MTWHSRAFGLALEGDPVPGLPTADPPPGAPRTVLRATTAAALDAQWPADGARRLSEERPEPGAPPRTIDEHPQAGWRLDAPGWGLARVARDGSVVDCAREGAPEWRWQRFAVGRALPFAAVAAGLEALHAAAVVLDSSALAIVGPTGAGKSSVAAALCLLGAPLLADDVLAVRARDGALVAFAGPPVVALRDSEAELLGTRVLELGAQSGAGGGKRYVETPAAPAEAPLARIAVLRRSTDPGRVTVARLHAPGARLVLEQLFVPELATAQRLRGQLDLLTMILADVRFCEVRAGRDATAADVAEAVAA